MITVKTRNGHVVRFFITPFALVKTVEGDYITGVAECAGCGVLMGISCEHPPDEAATDEVITEHLHTHILHIVEEFEKEACVAEPSEDEVYDWTAIEAGEARSLETAN